MQSNRQSLSGDARPHCNWKRTDQSHSIGASSPRGSGGSSWIFRYGPMPLSFVPNQRRLCLNDAEVGMLAPGRKREGSAQGDANHRRSKVDDLASHLKFQDLSPLPISNYHRGESECDNSAVHGLIAHTRCHQITDQYRRRTFRYYIRRSDTGALIGNPGGGLSPDENGRASGRQNRAANMRHRRGSGRDHRTSVHIAYSSCRRHNISLADC